MEGSVTDFLIDAMVFAPGLQYSVALFIAFFGFVLSRFLDASAVAKR
jgi:hypothetical protein